MRKKNIPLYYSFSGMLIAISIFVGYGISPLRCHAADQVQNTLSTTETGLLSTSGIYDSITWSVEDNKLTLTGTGAVLPDSEGAFPWDSYRHQIESVVVGEGITALGDWTFTYMECLKSIELPETLESIGKDCFSYDTALQELNLPRSVTSVGGCCAEGCTSLRSASLPGVNDIPERSFYNCSALEYITLSDQLSHVDARAFTGCVRLLKDSPFATVGNVMYTYTGNDHIVRIPEGITVIADGAFSAENRGVSQAKHNDRLVAVICPESLRHIGQKAFEKCDITMDGSVNRKDVQAILQAVNWIAMLEEDNYLTDAQMELGNVVQRNIPSVSFPLDTLDALAILRYINFRDVLEEDITLEQISEKFEKGR